MRIALACWCALAPRLAWGQSLEEVLRAGLERMSHPVVPVGEITVAPGDAADDRQARRFGQATLATLRELERNMLVRVDGPGFARPAGGRAGGATVVVTPSATLRNVSVSEGPGLIRVKRMNCDGVAIARQAEYVAPNLSERFQLVIGTYRLTPTSDWARLVPGDAGAVYRFRALVHADPFTHGFRFVTADWGRLERGDWETRNVR